MLLPLCGTAAPLLAEVGWAAAPWVLSQSSMDRADETDAIVVVMRLEAAGRHETARVLMMMCLRVPQGGGDDLTIEAVESSFWH